MVQVSWGDNQITKQCHHPQLRHSFILKVGNFLRRIIESQECRGSINSLHWGWSSHPENENNPYIMGIYCNPTYWGYIYIYMTLPYYTEIKGSFDPNPHICQEMSGLHMVPVHHLPWGLRLRPSGRKVWIETVETTISGVKEVWDLFYIEGEHQTAVERCVAKLPMKHHETVNKKRGSNADGNLHTTNKK